MATIRQTNMIKFDFGRRHVLVAASLPRHRSYAQVTQRL